MKDSNEIVDENHSKKALEIVTIQILKSLRGFCIVILQHQVLLHVIVFKVSVSSQNFSRSAKHLSTTTEIAREFLSRLYTGPSPGFSSRGGQKSEGGAKTQNGGHIF